MCLPTKEQRLSEEMKDCMFSWVWLNSKNRINTNDHILATQTEICINIQLVFQKTQVKAHGLFWYKQAQDADNSPVVIK